MSERDPRRRGCDRCLMPHRVCVCPEIPRIETHTRVVIVRHHTERFRSSNSGRLAHLALPNSVIVEHGGRSGPAALPALDRAWLLFPEGEPRETIAPDAIGQLVVLDATWSQARRMYRKVSALRGLPILRLPEAAMAKARLRASPAADRISTIEAIARALGMIEGPEAERPLLALFDLAVARAAQTGRSIPG